MSHFYSIRKERGDSRGSFFFTATSLSLSLPSLSPSLSSVYLPIHSASLSMAASPSDENPLTSTSFVNLAPSVYLQEPPSLSDDDDSGKQPPKTIVLAFWMNAPPRALVKYVLEYRRLAPSARIVFILSSTEDFTVRATTAAQHARVGPAVEALRATVSPENPVFLHMFSNGGVCTTTHLLAAYKKATGNPLSISSMIIDSAPGRATIKAAARAFSYVLPKLWILRFFGKVILYTALVAFGLLRRLTRMPDAVSRARKAINDGRLLRAVCAKGALRRCYMYSDADRLIDCKDVETHAADAEANGWKVQREKFQGTPHVGHMRADPERYWAIVAGYLQEAS
jgi:hypothetical protein